MPNSSKCKGCGAAIYWIKYLGKNHPIDVKPKRGFIILEDEYGNDIGVEQAAVHESHFATCPKANEFRAKKPSRQPIEVGDDAAVNWFEYDAAGEVTHTDIDFAGEAQSGPDDDSGNSPGSG